MNKIFMELKKMKTSKIFNYQNKLINVLKMIFTVYT